MKKIVILSDDPERVDMLIVNMHILFPECEIQVLSKRMEILGDVHAGSGFDTVNPVVIK